MVDPDGLDDVSDEALQEQLLTRPPTGVRDLQYLYGSLYTLATAGEGEYDPYLTPDAARDFLGEENSLIVVRVDMSGDAPHFDGVEVREYTEDLIDKVAHCKYSAGRGKDHSITHQSSKSGNLPDQLADYAVKRISDWPLDSLVQEAAEGHPDGDLLNRLAGFGESEAVQDDVYLATIGALADAGVFDPPEDADDPLPSRSDIVDAFRDADDHDAAMDDLADEHPVAETQALVTVRVKTEPDGDYRWPGEVDVFQEAMKRRRLGKFRSKNEAEDSVGEGVDLITGENTRVVGTPEDPLKYYLSMQTERMPNFDADESWRSQPLGEDAALRVLKAEEFLDACEYAGFGGPDTRVYYLPYFVGEPTVKKARILYRILAELTESDDPEKPPLVRAYNATGKLRDELRFYTIVLVQHQHERIDVLGEGTDQTTVYPVEVANMHRRVLGGPFFEDGGAFRPTDAHPLLDPDTDLFNAVAGGQYVYYTFSDHSETSPMSNPVVDAFYATVSGEPLGVSTLLEEFVAAIDEHDTQEYGFPTTLIASQLAQLCSLSQTGLLTAHRDSERPFLDFDAADYDLDLPMPDNTTSDSDPDTNSDDEQPDDTPAAPDELPLDAGDEAVDDETETARQRREKRLQTFLDNHPPLREDPERRAAFCLGALIGHLSNYQRWDGKNRTLADRHQPSYLTKSNIKSVTTNVFEKNRAYATESGYGVMMFGELTSRLMDTMQTRDPSEWDLSVDDLRWHYSLGIAYGLEQAYADRTDAETADDDDTTSAESTGPSSEEADETDTEPVSEHAQPN